METKHDVKLKGLASCTVLSMDTLKHETNGARMRMLRIDGSKMSLQNKEAILYLWQVELN